MRAIPLPDNSGATGSAIVDDSIAFVANPNLNTVSRINYLTGETAEIEVGPYPQGIVFARGRIFVLEGNLENFMPAGPSSVYGSRSDERRRVALTRSPVRETRVSACSAATGCSTS